MTRRAAAGLGRLLPLLLISAAVVVVAGAALLAACGGSSGGSSTAQPTATVTVTASGSATSSPPASPSPSASPAQTTVRLYFLRDEKLGVAERRVANTTMPATAAMKALLAGPTADESAAGLDERHPRGYPPPQPDHRRRDRARRPLPELHLRRHRAVDGGACRRGRLHADAVLDRAFRRVPAWRGAPSCGTAPTRRQRAAESRRLASTSSPPSSSSRRASAPWSEPVRAHRHGQRVRGHVPGAPRRLVRQAHRQRRRPGQPRRSRTRPLLQGRSPSPPQPGAAR